MQEDTHHLGIELLPRLSRNAVDDVFRAKAGPAMAKMEAGFNENPKSYLLVLPQFLVTAVAPR